MSSLHSLLPSISFGTCAAKWVEALTSSGDERREQIRNFINSWEGKTYDPKPREVTEDEIDLRMGTDDPMRLCPSWAIFLTEGVDVGLLGQELIFRWLVSAWGRHGRGQLVDFGISWSKADYLARKKHRVYDHADGGEPLRPVRTGIDSGAFTDEIYKLCAELPGAWAVKGSSTRETMDWFSPGLQRVGLDPKAAEERIRAGNYDLIRVNTHRTQEWLESRLGGVVRPDHPDWYSIPRMALRTAMVEEVDLKSHLTGDWLNEKNQWEKRYEDQHFRDALRYSQVLAQFFTRNGKLFARLPPRKATGRGPSLKQFEPSLITQLPEI